MILFPICSYPIKVVHDALLVKFRPSLNFSSEISRGINFLYTNAIMSIVVSFTIRLFVIFDEDRSLASLQDLVAFISLVLLVLISLGQSYVNFKLSQLVYILPRHYKWILFKALAFAGIFVSLYYSIAFALVYDVPKFFTNEETKRLIELCFEIFNTIVFFVIYFTGYFKSKTAINELSKSKITVWAIKAYVDDRKELRKVDREEEYSESH